MIREIGSDIQANEKVLSKGETLAVFKPKPKSIWKWMGTSWFLF